MVVVLTLNKVSSDGLLVPDSPRNLWATRRGPAAGCHLYSSPSPHCSEVLTKDLSPPPSQRGFHEDWLVLFSQKP